MTNNWYQGNAGADGAEHRGWLVGHFIGDSDDVRATKDVEIKWGIHPAGDARADWSTDEYRTTVVLLIRGRFHVNFPGESVPLEHEGDYVMWGPGLNHSWRADSDSVVITIRWPSFS
jgi:hypothetical protein